MGGQSSKHVHVRTIIDEPETSPDEKQKEEDTDELQQAQDSLGIKAVEQDYPEAAPPVHDLPTIREEDEDETLTIEDDSKTKSAVPSFKQDMDHVIPVQIGTSLQKSLPKRTNETRYMGEYERHEKETDSSVGDVVTTVSTPSRPNSTMAEHHLSLMNMTQKKKDHMALTQREMLLLERESYEYKQLTGSSRSLISSIARGQVRRNVSFRDEAGTEAGRKDRTKDVVDVTVNQAAEMHKNHNAKSFTALIADLTSGFKSDATKIKAILAWICKQSIGRIDFGKQKFDPDTPNGYMQLMQDGNGTYPGLFALMCRAACIKCVIINGVSKGAGYEVGSQHTDDLQNTWNAVFIDDGWRLVHPLWVCKSLAGRRTRGWVTIESQGNAKHDVSNVNSGVVSYSYNDYFIFTKPEEFIYRHFPEDPKWQLLQNSISLDSFWLKSYLRPSFFINEFTLLGEDTCVFDSHDGEPVEISIGFPESVATDVVFGYELSLRLDGDNEVDKNSVQSSSDSYGRYVFVSKFKNHVSFEVRFSKKGKYKLKLFGGLFHEYGNNPPWIMDAKIVCSNVFPKLEPLPFDPGIVGWGPNPIAESLGLFVPSHEESVVHLPLDDVTVIQFILKHKMDFDITLRHYKIRPGVFEDLLKYELLDVDDVIQLRISLTSPKSGEYALKIDVCNENEQENACNYLVRTGKVDTHEDFHKRKARKVLSEAMMTSDTSTLTHALTLCEESALPLDDPDVTAAEKRLEYLECKAELKTALLVKRIDKSENALYRVQQANLDRLFEKELKRVKRHLKELISLDKEGWNSRIPEIDRMTLMELSQLRQPRQPVKYVIMMMYLLLGVSQDFMTDWIQIKLLLRNKDSTLVEMARLESYLDMESVEITSLDENTLERVEEVIQTYSEEDIRKIDNTAAAFYIWVRMIHGKLRQRIKARPPSQHHFTSMIDFRPGKSARSLDLTAGKSANSQDLRVQISAKPKGLTDPLRSSVSRHKSYGKLADVKMTDVARSRSFNIKPFDSKDLLGTEDRGSMISATLKTPRTSLGMASGSTTAAGLKQHNITTGYTVDSRQTSYKNDNTDNNSLLQFSPVGSRLSAFAGRRTARPKTRLNAIERKASSLSKPKTATPNDQAVGVRSSKQNVSSPAVADKDFRNDSRLNSINSIQNGERNDTTNTKSVSRRTSRISMDMNKTNETQIPGADRKIAQSNNGAAMTALTHGSQAGLNTDQRSLNKNAKNTPTIISLKGSGLESRLGTTNSVKSAVSKPSTTPAEINGNTPTTQSASPGRISVDDIKKQQNGRLKTAMVRRGTRPPSKLAAMHDKADRNADQLPKSKLADGRSDRNESRISKANDSKTNQTFIKK